VGSLLLLSSVSFLRGGGGGRTHGPGIRGQQIGRPSTAVGVVIVVSIVVVVVRGCSQLVGIVVMPPWWWCHSIIIIRRKMPKSSDSGSTQSRCFCRSSNTVQ
jgi:hypothetical protein